MMRIEDYESVEGFMVYDSYDISVIDGEIEEKGYSKCFLSDAEMGYLIRAGYKIELTDSKPFDVIYASCNVSR